MNGPNVIEIEGLEIYRYIMPGIESNMYLVMEDGSALIVDPNVNEDAVQLMKKEHIKKVMVLLTHEHYDHISGVNMLREAFDTEVVSTETTAEILPSSDKNMAKFWKVFLIDLPLERVEAGLMVGDEDYSCYADKTFRENMDLTWKSHKIRMRAAPGHSKGGALIFLDSILFSGDNLVNGAGVICRLPGGDWKIYCEVTRPLIEALPDSTWVLPGHSEPGRLGGMRKYLQKFGEVIE